MLRRMAWRVYATAALNWDGDEGHATLYLTPEGQVCLRAQHGPVLLAGGLYPSVPDALLGAALAEHLPQPLYEALMDAAGRREA